jgi:surfactin synthase thioesterase subunit
VTETVLICLPFSGAGASFFRDWQLRAPAGLRVLPVQLPGREERFVEPLLTDAGAAADEARDQVAEQLRPDDRVALFGHSLGAVLAFELARRLDGTAEVAGLFVSGSPDPWNGRSSSATGLPDDEFLARVERFAGFSHPALADDEVRELVLPLLRADVEMHENYRAEPGATVLAPITAVRGRDDDLVSAEASAGWRHATTGSFHTAELDGGHMYLIDGVDELLTIIGSRLELARVR